MRQRIRIVATAFVMSPIELKLGAQRLQAEGFDVTLDRRCFKKAGLFAGTDLDRAQALIEAVYDDACDIVWLARGGYGGARLLPLLEHAFQKRGRPARRKVLVGYSDATALLGFARRRWGMHTLHGPMPGLTSFCRIPEEQFRPLVEAVRGARTRFFWEGGAKIRNLGAPFRKPLEGEVVGGNLSVWSTLRGTRWAEPVRDRILFLEEVDEPLYRIDRDFQHVVASGGLVGVKALVLGTFDACRDVVGQGLQTEPQSEAETRRLVWEAQEADKGPLRPTVSLERGLEVIFGEVGARLGIPVLAGLPAGHGASGQNAFPLGARLRLSPAGTVECLGWKGFTGSGASGVLASSRTRSGA